MIYGSVCSGIEAASVAWSPLGWTAAWLSEIERFPSQVLAHHYPTVPNLGDMRTIARRVLTGEVEAPDVLVGGTPCFSAGHMVLCSSGYKPIQDVIPGDMVVTHKGRLKRVARTGNKLADVGRLSGVGMPCGITTTPEHPFLSVNFRMQSTKRQGAYAKVEHCGEPEWTPASELAGRNWCALTAYEEIESVIRSTKFSDDTAMYLAGMYLGDGYIRDWGSKTKKAVVFCLNAAKLEKFKAAAGDAVFSISKERTVIKVTVCDTQFATWLAEQFGRGSDKKRVPAWAMGHPMRGRLIQGYIDTDGHAKDNGFRANSVSRALAYGMADLANSAGYVASVSFVPKEPTCVIEGRTCNQKSYWSVLAVHAGISRKSRVRHGYLLRAATSFEEIGIDRVFNIEVEDDNSFVLDGAVVHNCQAFSIAGLREGLSDERGQLTISYVRLFDAIDFIRGRAGKRASIAVWENVPGVLSSKDNAFGCFLGALAGEDVELVPPGKKWANAGCVFGPTRTVAWRTLDAQYFGVAQRRRRVFVVASARKDCDPAKILFEFDGVRRDSAPSREARQDTAAGVVGGIDYEGNGHDCGEPTGPLLKGSPTGGGHRLPAIAYGGGNTSGSIDVATCLTTSGQRLDFDTETFAIQSGALRTNPNSGPDGIGVQEAIAYTLEARAEVQAVCVTGDITHTLKAEGFDASEDGTGRGQPIVPMVFDPNQVTSPTNRSKPTPELSHTLPARANAPVAFQSSQSGVRPSDIHATLDANNGPRRHNGALVGMAVRRLMPMECARLQAFPDDYLSAVRVGGKPPADGPMYKSLGNSFCVNVVRWIGERMQAQLTRERT